jgi:hypothetical protein
MNFNYSNSGYHHSHIGNYDLMLYYTDPLPHRSHITQLMFSKRTGDLIKTNATKYCTNMVTSEGGNFGKMEDFKLCRWIYVCMTGVGFFFAKSEDDGDDNFFFLLFCCNCQKIS